MEGMTVSEVADSLPALMQEAQGLRAAGDPHGAIVVYRRAAAVYPDAWPRHALGETLLDIGEVDAAASVYADLLGKDLSDIHSLMGLGLCARRSGGGAAALPWVRRAASARPDEVWPNVALAETLLELGQPTEAAAAYSALLAHVPTQMQAMVGLGLARGAAGDQQGAAEALRDAVQAHPTELWPRMALTDALLGLGLAAEAEENCRAVLGQDPTNLQALVNLAACRRMVGDQPGGAAVLQQAIVAHPQNPWPSLIAAELAADAGQFDHAAAVLTRLLAHSPTTLDAWEALGRVHRRASRLPESLDAFARAAALDAGRLQPWLERATILRQLGRLDEADAALHQVLTIDPTQDAALLARSELCELQGRVEAALDLARRAAALAPGRVENLVAVSRCLALQGRTEEAEAVLEPLAGLPDIAQWRAELAGRAGEWARARAMLEQALAAHPRHPTLPASRARAALRAGEAASLVPPTHVPAAERARFLLLQGESAGFDLVAARANYRAARQVDPASADAAEGDARTALLSLDVPGTRAALAALARLRAAERAALGLVPRPSQTQIGQLLDEFIVDAACLAALREAVALPPVPSAARLRAIAAEYPDLTGPAVLLLVAMRRAGYLRDRAEQADGIPRIVGQSWEGGALPAELAKLQASWQAPGWRHVCLDVAAALSFLERHHPPALRRAFLMAEAPAQRADLLRLAWLAVEGGIWADIDDRCLAGPEALIKGAGLLLWQDPFGTLGNNLIGAPPGHGLISAALETATQAVLRGDADMMWLSTGPGLLTRAFAKWLPTEPKEWPAALENVRIPDAHELGAKVAVCCPAAYKVQTRVRMQPAGGRVT